MGTRLSVKTDQFWAIFVAYIFTRTSKKVVIEEEEEPANQEAATVVAAVSENPVLPASVTQPVKLREPIPEDQQRELFKWLLEEKRKVKAKDPEEKKRIDEEKALLKQFIRAKSIPSLWLWKIWWYEVENCTV